MNLWLSLMVFNFQQILEYNMLYALFLLNFVHKSDGWCLQRLWFDSTTAAAVNRFYKIVNWEEFLAVSQWKQVLYLFPNQLALYLLFRCVILLLKPYQISKESIFLIEDRLFSIVWQYTGLKVASHSRGSYKKRKYTLK